MLERSTAVIHRLDRTATQAVDPPGTPAAGYDPVFRTTVVYDDAGTGARTDSRRELPVLRAPCQVEMYTEDRLRQAFTGQVPSSNLALVFWRYDLERLGLLDAATREFVVRVDDRVSALENTRTGAVTRSLGPNGTGLFIFEVRAASHGFGPDGYDLEIIYLNDRPRGVAA